MLEQVVLSPEQVVSEAAADTQAALVDSWGRPHRLAAVTQLGRIVNGATICILAPTISRRHAELALVDGTWRLTDLGSAHGTFVDDERVSEQVLHDRSRVRVGDVGFYFVADVADLPAPAATRAISKTIAPQVGPPARECVIEFQQPTGGGGAVMTVGGKRVQLTIAQHELMLLLIERMRADEAANAASRGFVSIDELLVRLSLDSSEAAPGNVRQLVRRVRRLLLKAGIDDLIESRHSRGYRLVVTPRSP